MLFNIVCVKRVSDSRFLIIELLQQHFVRGINFLASVFKFIFLCRIDATCVDETEKSNAHCKCIFCHWVLVLLYHNDAPIEALDYCFDNVGFEWTCRNSMFIERIFPRRILQIHNLNISYSRTLCHAYCTCQTLIGRKRKPRWLKIFSQANNVAIPAIGRDGHYMGRETALRWHLLSQRTRHALWWLEVAE